MVGSRKVTRLLDAREEILGDAAEDPSYLHAVLAQVSLPYREQHGERFIRECGRAAIVVQAGTMRDPRSGRLVPVGLPYGSRPRLVLIHLCSEAKRAGSPRVEVGASLSGFMRDLGLHVTGGGTGTIGRFRDQLNRLAGSRLQLFWDDGAGRSVMENPAPIIRRMELWPPADPGQRVMWPQEVTLSDEFFAGLKDHAFPLDPRALRALQASARALDVYSWLVHRLPRVRRAEGEFVSWGALQRQFGEEGASPRVFRRKLTEAVRQALAVYPEGRVEPAEGGLRLHHSRPAIGRTG